MEKSRCRRWCSFHPSSSSALIGKADRSLTGHPPRQFGQNLRSERIVQAREHRGALTPVSHIDITHHGRPCDTTEPEATDGMQPLDGKVTGMSPHLAQVDK